MMGHRTPSMSGSEYDVVYSRKWYGHKAGGATVYAKRAMNRRERQQAKRLTASATPEPAKPEKGE